MVSHTGRYAVRAVVYIASTSGDQSVTAAEISGRTGIPHNYLTKILSTLAQVGVLESSRGPSGGFRLARAPTEVSLADVLESFESIHTGGCILGPGCCPRGRVCPAQRQCRALSDAIGWFFRTTSIADLADGRRDRIPAGQEAPDGA